MRLSGIIFTIGLIFCIAVGAYGAVLDDNVNQQRKTDVITGDNETVTLEHLKRFAEKDGKEKVFDNSAFHYDGFLRVKYANVKYQDESSMYLRSYLDVNLVNIGLTGLSFHFFGEMQNSLKNADEDLNLYYGYIRYKTFQNAVDVMAGRFELINNNFMTIDGGQVSLITPHYFGVLLYGGVPFYKEFEDSKEVFRSTGDLIYGGRVFLSGIENAKAYVGYSRETGKGDKGTYTVFNEIVSAGGTYLYDMSIDNFKSYVSGNGIVEYDPFNGALARLSGKFNYRYGMLELVAFGDMFDVQDQYPKGRELIIRLLSNGRERRVGGDIAFIPFDWLSFYGGVYGTDVELSGGGTSYGLVYKAGFDLYLMKYAGISLGGEYYFYDTHRYDAMGGVLSGEWRFTQDFSLVVSGEYASFKESSGTVNAYAVDTELIMHLTRFLTVSVFYEKGEKNRFMDDMRCGATVKYAF